jgi:hypothetical protein
MTLLCAVEPVKPIEHPYPAPWHLVSLPLKQGAVALAQLSPHYDSCTAAVDVVAAQLTCQCAWWSSSLSDCLMHCKAHHCVVPAAGHTSIVASQQQCGCQGGGGHANQVNMASLESVFAVHLAKPTMLSDA